ncbi:hypothetical protein RJT34_19696 [Clitoria ternatea]|uniref:Late embryogenesis abundant protein ECP63-like domain-containing protein n=1 Tax=Clitoria ternatea TaxID=43366 RepID=A0AAN9P452_CLITE
MASGQQFKEDRAEAAAKLAAKDIGDINRTNERDEGYTLNSELNFKQARAEAAAKLAAKDLEDVNRAKHAAFTEHRHDEQKPGVIGSMFRAAKEAVVGKPHEEATQTNYSPGMYDSATGKAKEYKDYTAEKAKETKDATMQKAGEYADYASQKAKETKDMTMDKAKEAKDKTVEKASEYKDYTAEKAREGKDSAAGKLGELKDRAMGLFSGKKDETMEKAKGEGEYRSGEKMVIRMEESRPGVIADALKAAGQAVNDAGRMEEEGVIHVERRREKM